MKALTETETAVRMLIWLCILLSPLSFLAVFTILTFTDSFCIPHMVFTCQ